MGDENEINVNIEIPFPTERIAGIIYHVLRVDTEPKRGISKQVSFKENILYIKFAGALPKQVRVAVNSLFDNINLIRETIEFIGEPDSDTYSHF